jgi:hypothetical protein
MGIVEWFQGLGFGEQIGLLTLLVATIGVGFQTRSYRVDRAEQRRAERHDAQDRRAILVLERAACDTRQAAFTLGRVVREGQMAGQHFVATIRNNGPHMADTIRVAASLGDLIASVVSAPPRLPAHSRPEVIDLLVPFGTLADADIMERIRNGSALRVRIDFTDGTTLPAPLEQCFVFRLDSTAGGGRRWVSYREECSAPLESPASHQT